MQAQIKWLTFEKSDQLANTNSKQIFYWFCRNCEIKALKKERLVIKLSFPFQIQYLPEIRSDRNYFMWSGKLKANTINYCVPEGLDFALVERGLVFQDDCVYLSSAKISDNSVKYSSETIYVWFIKFILFYCQAHKKNSLKTRTL